MAIYSESVYTRMGEVNSLLNAFGSNSNFSNSVLTDAYRMYLTDTSHGTSDFLDAQHKFMKQDGKNFINLNSVLASNIYLPAIVASPTDLLKLSGGGTDITAENGLTTLSYNA
jgi:hypothetical protein